MDEKVERPRRRVLAIHQIGYRGGAGTMLANMIAAANKEGYEFVVVCPQGDMTAEFSRLGATVLETPNPIPQIPHYTGNSYWFGDPRFLAAAASMLRSYPFWRDYLERQRPDVIQLDAMTLAPLLPACRPSGARVLCVVQETAVRGWLGLRSAWFRRLLSKMDGVMFISEYDRQQARCRAPIVEVIPNWVTLPEPPTSADTLNARRQLGLPLHGKIVLMMGGISRLKGTLTLLEAAARLHDIDGLIVCIAGYHEMPLGAVSPLRAALRRIRRAGDERHRVLDYIERHDLNQRIRLLGMQADVGALYTAADVLVFPSTRPHQARPVLEAGAAAKPVVVSGFANTAEFVSHEITGLTFPPGDSAVLALQLRRILRDGDLATRLGLGNRKMTEARHSALTNGRRYVELLDRILAKKPERH